MSESGRQSARACDGELDPAHAPAEVAAHAVIRRLAELRQDLRYGLRKLAGSPGFTAAAVFSLSLGISVATSAFCEFSGFFLRDVPGVSSPSELVGLQTPASYPQYRRYRELTGLFSSTLAYAAPVPFGISLGGPAERSWGHLVTPSYFATLGIRPAMGRVFGEEHEQPGRTPEVVVSYRFWQNRLGSDPAAVGKTLRVNGKLCTVIGVGPEEFLGASPMIFVADLWMPLSAGVDVAPELTDKALERHEAVMFRVIGRLRRGVSPARAEAGLEVAARQVELTDPFADRYRKGSRVRLVPGGKLWPVREEDLPVIIGLLSLLGGVILLIACSNIANMMVARAAERRKEIAIRLVLGAGRTRLVRQLLAESLLVAAGAGALGLCMSVYLMRLASMDRFPYPMPVSYDLTPDGRAVLFTLVLTAVAWLAIGLAPAVEATRTDLSPSLKEGSDVRFRARRSLSLRNLLMVSQVAASLTLLLLTGILAIGMRKTVALDAGFDSRNLFLTAVDPIRDGYAGGRAETFFRNLLERVRGFPSVTAACVTDTVPMGLNGNAWVTFFAGGGSGDSRAIQRARKYTVGHGYFETVGIPILAGRSFRRQDEAGGSTAVIVSEKLARQLGEGEIPVGRRIELASDDIRPFKLFDFNSSFDTRWGVSRAGPRIFEIVGVARDVADGLTMVKAEASPVLYFPIRAADYGRPSLQGVTLMVRAVAGSDPVSAVRREISLMDDKLVPFDVRSMPEQIDRMMFPVRVAGATYAVLGIAGLILASAGLAGLTAYSVARRGREIGIRVALGARGSDILWLVMKEGAVLVSVGTVIGLAGAWAGIRLLSGVFASVARMGGVRTSDPWLLAGAPLLLATLALAACYVPARRSLRIDPAVTLRQE